MRPEIGRFYLYRGELVEVRATWQGGAVLDGERVINSSEWAELKEVLNK